LRGEGDRVLFWHEEGIVDFQPVSLTSLYLSKSVCRTTSLQEVILQQTNLKGARLQGSRT
ncbi:pentapeptide repeat-containing protein, partial [Trichocoleus sp. FACHB-591]|nr:pentapeptide repeat-containing protein [Trichocoleus sp. FACHB-591]